MKLYSILSFLLAFIVLFPSCSILEPENDNHSTLDRVYEDPSFAEGLLIRAYTLIPTNSYRYDEVATDDAVTNNLLNNFKRIGTGEWTALFNPQNIWDNSNLAILYINHFLDVVEEVPWKWTDDELNALYIRRLTGEALAMRGMFKYFLLRNHAGYGTGGELLGTPIYNEFIDEQEEFSAPRPSFAASVQSAYEDLDAALNYLPLDYGNIGSLDELPAGFGDITTLNDYNDVFGDFTQQRMSGRHAKAIKARLALLAASPAFNPDNNQVLWENAANFTAELLTDIGGIAGLDANGHKFYLKNQVNDAELTSGNRQDLKEILWRRPIYNDRAREQANFPPSLYGNGEINPTHNLVEAFPMANGFPIDHPSANFDPSDPYANRDPRLDLYIVYDGSVLKGDSIFTRQNAGDDALDALQNSTRTGYYLKKLLREDVNVNPSSPSNQRHFNTHIRFTELFLNYAEAANEAWGPDGKGSHDFSAREVISAIRQRAGIADPDEYLSSINDPSDMRDLIRNERRIELCFEGFRFWDLRRWKADLTEPARGIRINDQGYTPFIVEERVYDNSYMHYGPIPDREITKFNLIQNHGWN